MAAGMDENHFQLDSLVSDRKYSFSSCSCAHSCTITRVQEIVQNKKNKFFFVVDVEMAGGSRKRVWRSYSDFFQLQCQLLDLFPEEAGQRNVLTRIIPYLPGRRVFSKSNITLAQGRQPQLELYLNELIKLPSKISQCKEVLTFLHPTSLDLELLNSEDNSGDSDNADEDSTLLPKTEDGKENIEKDHEYCFDKLLDDGGIQFDLTYVG